MNSILKTLLGALMAAALSLPAVAQTGKDRQLAETICGDQSGAAFKTCVNQQMQSFDCATAGDRAQCEARKQVSRQCAGKFGWDFRLCAECSTATDRNRCEMNQKALAACVDKVGPEHKNYLREQFGVT